LWILLENVPVVDIVLMDGAAPLDGIAIAGRHGNPNNDPGVTVTVLKNIGIVSVAARDGAEASVATVLAGRGVVVPAPSEIAGLPDFALIGTGPNQWTALSKTLPHEQLISRLAGELGECVSLADQSDGRVVLRIAGPCAAQVLSKGVMIDLDSSVFGAGSAALTTIRDIGITLWRETDAPVFELAAFRSMASSLWVWLMDAAAPLGCEVIVDH
jgi:sarcosine oxidase subunit gamma